jgi:hypothetical protein
MLLSKSNAPYLNRNYSYLYRLACHFEYNWRECSRRSKWITDAYNCGLFDGDVFPERQMRRLLLVRAYDEKQMMVAVEVVEGSELEGVAGGMLADKKAKYIKVHNARLGYFGVRVEQA